MLRKCLYTTFDAGRPRECNVEVRVKAFIPTEIVYGPAPLNFLLNDSFILVTVDGVPVPVQVAAFNGNNREFDYDSTDSKADIIGAFVIRERDFSDIQRIRQATNTHAMLKTQENGNFHQVCNTSYLSHYIQMPSTCLNIIYKAPLTKA